MAKILYGVCGEGMGHAVRSRVVIKHLLKKGREVVIVAAERGYKFLSGHFHDVFEVEGLYFFYEDNRVRIRKSIRLNLWDSAKKLKSFAKVTTLIRKFKPDIVISDFEPLTALAAKRNSLPLISIDNQHIISVGRVDNCGFLLESLLAKAVINNYPAKADYYFVTTFFYPKLKKGNATLVSPILREEILKIKPSVKKHILVYQTSSSYRQLIDVLLKFKSQRFIVYGMSESLEKGNVTMKNFSESEFIRDFASCQAIIVNGGFTVLGEALYLKKPVLSVPVKRQFEQKLNAFYIEKLGFGDSQKEITEKSLADFLSNLARYRKNLRNFKHDKNAFFFRELDKIIGKFT